jgi:cytochrome P450
MMDPYLRPRPVRGYIDDLVRPTARALVAKLHEGMTVDLVSEYFEPISVRGLGDFLGYKTVDTDTLRAWFHGLSLGFSNKALDENGNILHPEGFAPSDEVSREIHQTTDPMIERLTKEPDDSGISHWLHDGMPVGQVRPNAYIYPTLFTILLGGMQEPGHLMGSTLLGLFSQPEQLHRVLGDKTLIPRAITEGLRWLAPIQCASSRRARIDMELFGTKLKAGETVFMGFGSANRDEKEFDNADVYDIDRAPHPHMAFGSGRHACAGSNFSSELVRIGLEELFERFPALEQDPTHEVPVRGFFFRGPTELRARLAS